MKMKFFVSCSIGLLPLGVFSAVAITGGTEKTRPTYPRSLSGITYAGGDVFYAVADSLKDQEVGLYACTIKLSGDGKTISACTIPATNRCVRLEGATDLEAVAFDPATGSIWAANETTDKTIKEYDPQTGAVLSVLETPSVMNKNVNNYGYESLTISGDGLTMWISNEEALTCDGPRSSISNGTTVRLTKFVRKTVKDKFELVGQYPYTTDKWHQDYSYGTAGRGGVSDLCALPDGSLLVLERELSSDTEGTGFWAGVGVNLYSTVYHVATPELATDVSSIASITNAGMTVASCAKTRLFSTSGWKNYEGICLGPRLADGNLSLIMVTDAGDGITAAKIYPLVLSGLDAH